LYNTRAVTSSFPGHGSSGDILAIHFVMIGFLSIWLRLYGDQIWNDHVPGAIFLKWEAGPNSGRLSAQASMLFEIVAIDVSFGTGAIMRGAVATSPLH
jgi:hypothetical protein